ncbi:MAG: hypothetical protein WCK96_02845 [Methylococcales bacterium]
MSKEISTIIGSVMRVAAANPALLVAIATSGAVLMLGSSIAHTLVKRGKNVKFSIGDMVQFKAEFYPPS